MGGVGEYEDVGEVFIYCYVGSCFVDVEFGVYGVGCEGGDVCWFVYYD